MRPEGSVTVLPGGSAVGSLAAWNPGGPWDLEAPFQLLERRALDPSLGLALLRVEGGVPLPLAPAPPRAGTELAAGSGFGDRQVFQPCLVTERLSDGFFLFRGNILPSSVGAPLVNRRAELVGVVLGRPEGYPGHDYNLAADSSILLEWSEQGRVTSRPGPGWIRTASALVARDITPIPLQRGGRANPRVVPGTALGIFRIGNSRQEVQGFLGTGVSGTQGRAFETLSYPVHKLEFTVLGDRVVAITTTDSFYSTSKGVRVGTRWSQVRRTAEFAEVLLGPLPGTGQRALAPGLEVELDWEGRIQKMRVTPR